MSDNSNIDQFLAMRPCIREPVPEIAEAAELLSQALDKHLAGDSLSAERLIRAADMPQVRAWIEPLLGSNKRYPERIGYVRFRKVAGAPPILPKAQRVPVRMPSAADRSVLLSTYGYNCAFCGIPLVSRRVRLALNAAYPGAAHWGTTCHAALLAMWLQFDHVLPHSRGGDNCLSNLVIACSGCNYGRMSFVLEEVGVLDPRDKPISKTGWDGLERMRAAP